MTSEYTGRPRLFYPSMYGGKYHWANPIDGNAQCRPLELDTSADPIHVYPNQERVHPIVCKRCLKRPDPSAPKTASYDPSFALRLNASHSSSYSGPTFVIPQSARERKTLLSAERTRTAALHDIAYPFTPSSYASPEKKDQYKRDVEDHLDEVSRQSGIPRTEPNEHGFRNDYEVHKAWKKGMRRALSRGDIDWPTANARGYRGEDAREGSENHAGWRPLPHDLYHVTTDVPAVMREGLKTREETNQQFGKGLGGGSSETVSVTTDHGLAHDIHRALHEYHQVLNGKISIADMRREATSPTDGAQPYADQWEHSDQQRQDHDAADQGVKVENRIMTERHARNSGLWDQGYRPITTSHTSEGANGELMHGRWTRPSTPEEQIQQRSQAYKEFSGHRGWAGGRRDPLFMSNDPVAFAKSDPNQFGILHMHPHAGAQGYTLSGSGEHHPGADSGEWRTHTGQALQVPHTVEQPDVGESLVRHAAYADAHDDLWSAPGERRHPADQERNAARGRGRDRRADQDPARGVDQPAGDGQAVGRARAVVYHPQVAKDLKRLDGPIARKARQVIDGLESGQVNPSTHALHGPLKGWQATSVNFANRVVHRLDDDGNLYVGHVGHHDDYPDAQRRLGSIPAYYHGTKTDHSGEIQPYQRGNDTKVWLTTDLGEAWDYARKARHGTGAPRVYEVHPKSVEPGTFAHHYVSSEPVSIFARHDDPQPGPTQRTLNDLGITTEAEVRIQTDGPDGEPATGVMIALVPPTERIEPLLPEDGESVANLHMTLLYLGDADDMSETQLADLPEHIESWAEGQKPLDGKIQGVGTFTNPGSHVLYLSPNLPGAAEMHVSLKDYLAEHGYSINDTHGFTPHITLSYAKHHFRFLPKLDEAGIRWPVREVWCCIRGVWQSYPLCG